MPANKMGDIFTASRAVGYDLPPASRAGTKNRGPSEQVRATFASATPPPIPPPGPHLNQEGNMQARESRAARCSGQPHFMLDRDNTHVYINI
jgi:hypothetical protein